MSLVWVLLVWQVHEEFYMPTTAFRAEAVCQAQADKIPRGWGVPGNPPPPLCMAIPVRS